MASGEESAMVATKEKRNYPRSKNPRLTVDKLSKKEQDYPTDPDKSWKPCKWQLTFDAPGPSTTFQEASKEDSRLAGWQLGKKRPAKLFPLMYDQHGYPVRCVECGMKWKTEKAPGKRHNSNGFVLDSEGNKVPICVIARQNEKKAQQNGNSAKRLKSNPAQSAAKQRQQPSNASDTKSTASGTESTASGVTNLIMKHNAGDFQEVLRNCETRTEQSTKPGLMLDESSNAEMNPSTDANGDLTQMGSGNNDQATLTTDEKQTMLDFVNRIGNSILVDFDL